MHGLTSVLVTPFAADGSLDLDGLDRVVDFALDAGASAVAPLGVMGESAYLDEAERRDVLARVVARVDGRRPIVVGISSDDTSVLLERARLASAAGASAMVAVPESGDLASHLALLAAAEPTLELVVQHYPLLPHPTLGPVDLAAAIRSVPTVVGVKEECPPTGERIRALRELLPHTALVGGLSALWLADELAAGSNGTMTGLAFPEQLVEMLDLAAEGRWDDLRQAYEALLPAIVFESQPGLEVALRKALLVERGVLASAATRATGGVSEASWARARELVRRFGR